MRELAESIELSGTLLQVNVLIDEYVRLLGYPRGWVLEGRARELADWARDSSSHHAAQEVASPHRQ